MGTFSDAQERQMLEEIEHAAVVGRGYYAKKQKRLARRGGVLSEAQIQMDFIDWCRTEAEKHPARRLLKLVYHIPNGEARPHRFDSKGRRFSPAGRKLQRMGVLPAIPDLHLPIGQRGFFSLYIEVKVPGEEPTEAQAEMHEMLRDCGSFVCVCRSVEEMKDAVCDYLGLGDWRGW